MHRLSISAFIGMLALTITGCGASTQNSTNTNSSTTVQPTVKPSTTAESTPETTQTTQKPTLFAKNPPPPTSTAGLIQSTNANQRTQQVQQGRSDPFAGLFAIPKPVVVTVKPRQVVTRIPKPVVPPPSPKPVVLKPNPLPIVPPPAPIAPPQPDLARSVTVLGVVEVGNELQAIVKVPTEATSRYITQGQRLSDGQVLVKRIELSPGAEPVVILEQNGIEVTRAVGEEPVQQQEEKTGRPSATILTSPLSQTSSPSSTAELNSILPNPGTDALPVPAPPSPSNKQIQSTKQPTIPPPPTSSPLPSLQLKSNLPESTYAVAEPDYPPPAVRTSPEQQPNNQTKVQRQRLIFQLLNSSRQSKSNSPLKSNSQEKRYKKLLSQLVKRR